jgi:hypothetical protein
VHTDLVGEAGEDGAAGAAGEPEHERVVGRAALGADEVVEEADAIALVHLHVPAYMRNSSCLYGHMEAARMDAWSREGKQLLARTLSGGGRGGVPGSQGDG